MFLKLVQNRYLLCHAQALRNVVDHLPEILLPLPDRFFLLRIKLGHRDSPELVLLHFEVKVENALPLDL